METTTKETYAITNAKGQLESIKELYREYKENASAFVSNLDIEEAIVERAREQALSVEFRSGWYSSPESIADLKPEEFKILLSWGGPACRIIGNLDRYSEPTDIEIQYQDWGTPWTTLEISYNQDDYQALEWFCNCFYFGD